MPQSEISGALAAEASALIEVTSGLSDIEVARPSPCRPWTVGELLCHVVIAVSRVEQALAETAGRDRDDHENEAGLVSTLGYYRPDDRFSAATNADRIETACALARRLGSAAAICAELGRRWPEMVRLLAEAPADRTVRTRHGDRMLLADFAVTRVVELAVHGLDVAAGLGREPWLTPEAGGVLERLLLPAGDGEALRARLGCDQAALIARLTGRAEVSPAEAVALGEAGAVRLLLG